MGHIKIPVSYLYREPQEVSARLTQTTVRTSAGEWRFPGSSQVRSVFRPDMRFGTCLEGLKRDACNNMELFAPSLLRSTVSKCGRSCTVSY